MKIEFNTAFSITGLIAELSVRTRTAKIICIKKGNEKREQVKKRTSRT